jgi:hypothetical protein
VGRTDLVRLHASLFDGRLARRGLGLRVGIGGVGAILDIVVVVLLLFVLRGCKIYQRHVTSKRH